LYSKAHICFNILQEINNWFFSILAFVTKFINFKEGRMDNSYYFRREDFGWKLVVLSLLVLLFLLICFYLYQSDLSDFPHHYIVGDWLINYQDAGFKRRGMSGSFFFLLQDLTDIPLKYLVFFTHISLYLIFFLNLASILKTKILNLGYVLLLFSPYTLLFLANDRAAVGRKEVILLAIFSMAANWVNKGSYNFNKKLFIMLSLFIASFFHEIVLFFIPYFFLLESNLSSSNLIENLKKNFGYVLATLIPILAILIWGGGINEGNSISILHDRGIEMHGGIFEPRWTQVSYNQLMSDIMLFPMGYFEYSISLTYMFFFLIYYLRISKKMDFLFSVIVCFLISIPMFFVALDWGRWLFIHFILISIILSNKLINKESNARNQTLTTNKISNVSYFFLIGNVVLGVGHYANGLRFSVLLRQIIKYLT